MARELLDPFGRAPDAAGIFLDFDGVLADIVPEPGMARVRDGVPGLLLALSERLGRIAVISGRPVAFVTDMIPTEVDVVGLYGLEWRIRGEHQTLPEAEPYRATVQELVEEATARFGAALVEPKGLSLTVHYRGDPELATPIREWVSEHGIRAGMDLREAKRSFELHPPILRDKGTALLELAEGLDPVAYIGDDLGDLPAFDGLDSLAADGVATLRVAVDSSETPRSLCRRADLVVDGPAGAEELLVAILAAAESTVG
jgi:trehalose 6-phosphate phosphatase